MPNRLASESSPYLLQHAENPVEWYPWGPDALSAARDSNRPILLSVGYAACHWCHVMAHESFEDPTTAALMNELFVCIKVDREERPDIDAIYMQAVQSMTGHGGWPMTVFLTPDADPFYGGTYFPPVDRHGMPSFPRILRAVADSFATRPESVAASAASMRQIYEAAATSSSVPGEIDDAFLESAFRAIASGYDARFGGFGTAPKFPPTMVLDFMLRHWARTGNSTGLEIARTTFIRMARGGIYDQIGGGFARYSVDAQWLVPHFEKMLYDNALLIRLGAFLYEATRDEEIRRVTEETVAWLVREMESPNGGFFSSLDADSEGEEGRFYVWKAAELDAVLHEDSALVRSYYGVTDAGNFEGSNILHVVASSPDFSNGAEMNDEQLAIISRAKTILYERRALRVWPARDDKVLAGWNGLALRGIAEAARALEREDFRAVALRNASFLDAHMVLSGRVMRSFKDGVTRIQGFLEDQASVALGFITVFEQSLDVKWLGVARTLALVMLDEF
ncbi:MAG TPA: thioredoxin domain-containing protein, partial [Gemmatimonadaceae bacterium]